MVRLRRLARKVCHPRFWNQGKALPPRATPTATVCHPRFWNQGKASDMELNGQM